MRITYCLVLPVAFVFFAGSANAVEYNQVLPEKSTLRFNYKQMGIPMEGKFSKFTARMVFDPAKLNSAQAQFDVDLASLDTGVAEADEEVKGKQWFNVKTFPTARFVSSGVKSLGGNRYEALGKLSIKGRDLNVSAPFTFKPEGQTGIFEGSFIIKRLDYAIGEGPWADVSAVANEIPIKFHLVAIAAPGKK